MKIKDYFYTEGETAKILSVARMTVWRWIRRGEFSIQRVGREVLIPKWEVELMRETKTK